MKKIYAIAPMYAEDMDALEKMGEKYLLDHPEKNAFSYTDDRDARHRPYQVVNGIAMYSIRGKMLSSSNFFTEMLGIATYDVIANDLAMMAQDEMVDQILISMDTPGGNVSGISDISDAWARANEQKPISVHTPGTLASAGMWLSSNSTNIYASATAEVGSIGVVMQHASYQRQLETDGVKVTEIKSSPMKAVGSPAKDLNEEEIKYLQKKVNESDELFQNQMKSKRPGVNSEAFNGETFSASESLRLGLIDGIYTFTEVFEELSASADSKNAKPNSYTEDYGMKRKVTKEMAEALISSGADAASLDIVSQEAYDTFLLENPDGEIETKDEATDEELEQEAVIEEEEKPDLEAQVVTLTEELGMANASVETLTAKVEELEGKLATASDTPLRKIAEERVSTLRVGLGLTKLDMSDFPVESLLQEYSALDTKFKAAFKPGGHVSTKANPKETEETASTPVIPGMGAVGF